MAKRHSEAAVRETPAGLVESLERGLAILSLYDEEATELGVGEMARALGVHRSTASRLAATLSRRGFLVPSGEQGRYLLGASLVRLGSLAARQVDVRSAALGPLREMVDALGETAHLGVLQGSEVVTDLLVDGWHSVRFHSTVGKRSPAHCSAMGKMLLSALDDGELEALFGRGPLEVRTRKTIRSLPALRRELAAARRRGYVVDDEELEVGLRCVAAPVFDYSGRMVAAVSVSGPVGRLDGRAMDDAIDAVQRTAAAISARLGARDGSLASRAGAPAAVEAAPAGRRRRAAHSLPSVTGADAG
ncbi:MAG TPA: IclR family transcriptional regulator [Acidimicrobiales bacterium]|nr:IclR family transcriptional regulator [Acidimicrobiales bacterium]